MCGQLVICQVELVLLLLTAAAVVWLPVGCWEAGRWRLQQLAGSLKSEVDQDPQALHSSVDSDPQEEVEPTNICKDWGGGGIETQRLVAVSGRDSGSPVMNVNGPML